VKSSPRTQCCTSCVRAFGCRWIQATGQKVLHFQTASFPTTAAAALCLALRQANSAASVWQGTTSLQALASEHLVLASFCTELLGIGCRPPCLDSCEAAWWQVLSCTDTLAADRAIKLPSQHACLLLHLQRGQHLTPTTSFERNTGRVLAAVLQLPSCCSCCFR
jgi:hypothetical protein